MSTRPPTPRPLTSDERSFLRDVQEGLSRPQKELPCKYFYDERGSELFERICTLDEYYLTRCEQEILQRYAGEMARHLGECCALIEYGSGSSSKTRLLLDRLVRPAAYVPVDINGPHLERSARQLASAYPGLAVVPVCADFTRPFDLPPLPSRAQAGALDKPARRVVYFSGSTIGNFGPDEAVSLLAGIARLCGLAGGLLIAVDLDKSPTVLEPAYDDAQGVTAAFNLNLLARINRELGADFDLAHFRHRAVYSSAHSRVEMHLVSTRAQTVHVGGRAFSFAEGESIHTENSYKFGLEVFRALAGRAGWEVEQVWTDERGLFSVQYLRVRD